MILINLCKDIARITHNIIIYFYCAILILLIVASFTLKLVDLISLFLINKDYLIYVILLPQLLLICIALHFIIPITIRQNLSPLLPEYSLYKQKYHMFLMIFTTFMVIIIFYNPEVPDSDIYEISDQLIKYHSNIVRY